MNLLQNKSHSKPQKSLQDIMSARLEDVKSITDPRAIRRLLEEAEPYEVMEEMKSSIDAANSRVAELTAEMKAKLEGVLDNEDIVPVTEALEEAKSFADERELSDTLRKTQQHLKNPNDQKLSSSKCKNTIRIQNVNLKVRK